MFDGHIFQGALYDIVDPYDGLRTHPTHWGYKSGCGNTGRATPHPIKAGLHFKNREHVPLQYGRREDTGFGRYRIPGSMLFATITTTLTGRDDSTVCHLTDA